MAHCKRCGQPAGMFNDLCTSCKEAEQRRVTLLRTEMEERALAAAEQKREHYLREAIARCRDRLAAGLAVTLYSTIYLPVDSRIDEDLVTETFSLGPLPALGFNGWEVIGVVPRTIGVTLLNEVVGTAFGTKSYGAAMGGNILGVHVLLRKGVSPEMLDIPLSGRTRDALVAAVVEADV